MVCPCMQGGKRTRKHRGGASHAPLSYVNPNYQQPSASAGVNRLISEPLLARPVLNLTGGKSNTRRNKRSYTRRNRKGGFYPSVMGSLINNGSRLIPAAGVQAYRMVRNYKPSKK